MQDRDAGEPRADPDALQKFGHLMSYLQYENTMYWERSNFFMLASTALLGFMAASLLPLGANSSWERVLVLFVVSLAGCALTVLWHRSMLAAEFWIDHWHAILRGLEPTAFGDIRLFRDPPPNLGGPARIRMRAVTRLTLGLFYVLWTLALAYAAVMLGIKLSA